MVLEVEPVGFREKMAMPFSKCQLTVLALATGASISDGDHLKIN